MAAILQTPDSMSLLGNLKSFIFSSRDDVLFVLRKDGEDIVSESYTPDPDYRVEIDIRDVVRRYLKTSLPTTNIYVQPGLTATFTAFADGISVASFTVIGGGVRKPAVSAEQFLTANFLTWQPQIKHVCWNSPEYLTYYFTQAGKIVVRFYTLAGAQETVTVGTGASGQVVSFNVMPSRLFSLSIHNTDQLAGYLDIWAESASGTRLSYVQRYICVESQGDEHLYICVNSLGGLDTFSFHGARTLSPNLEHESISLGGKKLDASPNAQRRWQQDTGFSSLREAQWQFELFAAQQAWAIIDGNAESIVIDTSSIQVNDRDNLHSCSFSFILSEEGRLLNFNRLSSAPSEIQLPAPTGELFFLTARLSDYPDATLADTDLFLIQSPYSETWYKASLASIRQKIEQAIIAAIPAMPDSRYLYIEHGLMDAEVDTKYNGDNEVHVRIPSSVKHLKDRNSLPFISAGGNDGLVQLIDSEGRAIYPILRPGNFWGNSWNGGEVSGPITFKPESTASPSAHLEVITISGKQWLHTRLPFYSDDQIVSGAAGGDSGSGSLAAGWGGSDGKHYTDLWVGDEEDRRRLSLYGHDHDERYYTKAWIDSALASMSGLSMELVDKLPAASAQTQRKIYLVPSATAEDGNVKDEYITIQEGGAYKWELIGSTKVDLTGFVKKSGDTMTGTLNLTASTPMTVSSPTLVKNLNADMVDGKHDGEFTALKLAKTVSLWGNEFNGESGVSGPLSFSSVSTPHPTAHMEVITISGKQWLHTRLPFYSDDQIVSGAAGGDSGSGSLAAGWGGSDGKQYTDLWVGDEEDRRRLSLYGHDHDERYYTKAWIDSALESMSGLSMELVDKLPAASAQTQRKIYLVPSATAEDGNVKDEYITIQEGGAYKWELIGSTKVDLSGYLKAADAYVKENTVTIGGMSVTVPTIYGLKFEKGEFSPVTYNPDSGTETVRIPTMTSHLTNNSGFAYTQDLNGYVTLKTAQTIEGQKTFTQSVTVGQKVILTPDENGDGGLYINIGNNDKQLFATFTGNDGKKYVLFGHGLKETHALQVYGKSVIIYTGNDTPAFAFDDNSGMVARHFFPIDDSRRYNLGTKENPWANIYMGSYNNFSDQFGKIVESWGQSGLLINMNEGVQRPVHINGLSINFFTDGNSDYNKRAAYITGNGLTVKRWYPNGEDGPYIEFDKNAAGGEGAFKVAGNMYVTGFLTSGAFGVDDVKTDISYSLIPTTNNAHDIGSSSRRFKTLYSISANFSGQIHTEQLTVNGSVVADEITVKTIIAERITGGEETLSSLASHLPANVGGTATANLSSIFTADIINRITGGTIRVIKAGSYVLNISGWRLNGNLYEIYAGGFTFVQTGGANWTITKN